jgi:hypothetical protein
MMRADAFGGANTCGSRKASTPEHGAMIEQGHEIGAFGGWPSTPIPGVEGELISQLVDIKSLKPFHPRGDTRRRGYAPSPFWRFQ